MNPRRLSAVATAPPARVVIAWAMLVLSALATPAGADLPRQIETPGLLARMLRGPMSGVEEIVLAERAPDRDGHWYANFGYKCHDANAYVYGPGGGKLLVLNVRTGRTRTLLDDPAGSIRDPQVHYDGKTILFSYRPGGTHDYHLYEIQSDGTGLTQITEGKDIDDYEPCYLPDGGIMFVSSRCYRWVPCWYTQVGVLYRCERDGSDIRQISFGVEHENHPWVLPDGRVLYTRWEYVDRFTNAFHHLWTVNPDGTAQMIFYGNLGPGQLLIDAKPIPDSDKIAVIFSPGHGKSEHQGDLTLLDVSYGADNVTWDSDTQGIDQARQVKQPVEKQINRHTRGTGHPKSMMAWRDVWPFSEECFLVCNQDGLYVMDDDGDFECIYRASRDEIEYADGDRTRTHPVWVHEPRLLAPRPREGQILSRVDDTSTTGTMVLSDAYLGRKMDGVSPGEVKKLLVLEELPKPVSFNWSPTAFRTRHYGESGSIIMHRVLGTVPVEPDGSAHFKVPAQRALFFVALDANDIAVKRMQSFVSVMPGETVSCVGCHERRVRAPHDRRQSYLQALTRGPSRIQQVPGVPASGLIDFPRDIQPILDRHCVKCHNPDKAGGGVRLDGARTPRWTFGYSSLIEKAQTGMAGGYYDRAQFGNMPPRTFGSPVSKLLAKVRTGHGDVKLSETDKSLLRAWVDSSACFAGTQQSLVLPEPSFPRLESGKFVDMVLMDKCAACHLPDKGRTRWPWQRDTWIDLADPARSHLVRAPLASSAGGLGLCRQRKARSSGQAPDGEQARNAPPANVFTSTDDQAYRALVQEIGDIMAGKGPGWRPADVTRPTYWQEGYVPHEWWVREMVRAGVLPAGWRSNANTDWFAIDERYYLLFRPVAERRNGGLARED